MTRAGCKGETVCFIFDESNVLSSGFLELMNALLASGEVPVGGLLPPPAPLGALQWRGVAS